jgi:Phospholipid-translocating ATPase N-terminal
VPSESRTVLLEGGRPTPGFGHNGIKTAKYNPVTFAPIFLFEMFSRAAYLYFLIQVRLMSAMLSRCSTAPLASGWLACHQSQCHSAAAQHSVVCACSPTPHSLGNVTGALRHLLDDTVMQLFPGG